MTRHALISVIVPAYNAEAYIAETLQSILSQKVSPLEVIVIDDGSQDNTAAIVHSFGKQVSYFYQRNHGTPAARNKGLQTARGELIAFLDADDLWSSDKLALQLRKMETHPDAEIIIGYTQHIRLQTASDGSTAFVPFKQPQPMLSMGSALIRKTVFDKVGFFDETFPYCDDIDWFLRAREQGINMLIHPETIQYYRKHTTNLTMNRRLDLKYQLLAYKKSIDRRKANQNAHQDLKNWSAFFEKNTIKKPSTGALR